MFLLKITFLREKECAVTRLVPSDRPTRTLQGCVNTQTFHAHTSHTHIHANAHTSSHTSHTHIYTDKNTLPHIYSHTTHKHALTHTLMSHTHMLTHAHTLTYSCPCTHSYTYTHTCKFYQAPIMCQAWHLVFLCILFHFIPIIIPYDYFFIITCSLSIDQKYRAPTFTFYLIFHTLFFLLYKLMKKRLVT